MIDLLFWPFMATLVISSIHVYLGLHVVIRGVIFVDLALAQVAAVGATVGFLLGLEPGTVPAYLTALAFTLLGAVLFTFTRDRKTGIPQEAIIGITYVVAAAVMILLLSKAPEGGEHIKALMVGSILFVTPNLVATTFILFAVIGMILFILRQKFMEVSKSYNAPEQLGRNRRWDFLFYVLFGLVVTSAVQIVGILLVFSYLIVPAVAAMLFYRTWRSRLVFGWLFSLVVSLLGMALSIWLDIPTGAAIVATFGGLLVLSATVKLVLGGGAAT